MSEAAPARQWQWRASYAGAPLGGAAGRLDRAALAPALLLLVLVLSLLPRLPLMASATVSFNADEAINALELKHLLEGREVRLFGWDASYYGIVEELLAVPFIGIFGFVPVAVKLGALLGFLALVWLVYVLGRRLYGTAAALAAAALLALFSPQVVFWSTTAASGYTLIIAWGTLTVLLRDRILRQPSPRALFAFGLVAGFGLYIYELYLVYLVAIAGACLISSFLWRAVMAPSGASLRAALRAAPRQLGPVLLLAAGFAIGWAPKLVLLLSRAPLGSIRPAYAPAGAGQIAGNLRLLAQCLPALFGVNPGGDPALAGIVGKAGPAARALGGLVLAFYAAAWLAGAWRARRELAGAFRDPPIQIGTEALLVLLVPVTLLLFTFSANRQDILSNRYLLPLLTSLPLLGGAMLSRLARTSRLARGAALALGLLLTLVPAAQIGRWLMTKGYLDHRLRPLRPSEPLAGVLRYLEARGIRGGYAEYWTSYKATFLAQERIVIAPFLTRDRYPAYTRQVAALPEEAYIFHDRNPGGRHGEAFLRRELEARGRPYQVHATGAYRIYTSLDRRRLLPPPFRPQPIAAPRALIAPLRPPTAATPGQRMELPIVLANRGSVPWSAAGLAEPEGRLRVDLSYRWLDPRGGVVIADGERTLLPLDMPPGRVVRMVVAVQAPPRPGSFQLLLSLVQEGVAWFDTAAAGATVYPMRIAGPVPGAIAHPKVLR